MSWKAIGEPRLDVPGPAELPLLAPVSAWPHAVGGPAGNRRAALPLGYARTTRWVCELPEGPPVMRLLALGERVLAIRAPDSELGQRVELIDGEGRHSRTIAGRAGDWAIDVGRSMVLGPTVDAELAAWSLDDPERPPILVFNRLSGREFDALRFIGETLVIVTHELEELGGPPPDVLVDVVRIPGYDDVSRWRSLRSQTRVAERVADGLDRVVLGFDPGGPVLASATQLWWGDWHLRERAHLDPGPDVIPLQYAPRGDGSGWFLTERADRPELWQLAVGRCDRALALDPQLVDAGPLLIGPDDAVVLTASSQVACYDADGSPRWSFPRSGAPTGMIDSHGVALYSDAGALISTDRQGVRATIWTAPDDVRRLGPLAATTTRLWVGAGLRVIGLE